MTDQEPATELGYIECCGVTVPIERIHVERGNMVFTGSRPGPLPAVSGRVAITGIDGIEFASGGYIDAPAVPEGKTGKWVLDGFPHPDDRHQVIPGEVLAPLALEVKP
jgi:hypothetical protein